MRRDAIASALVCLALTTSACGGAAPTPVVSSVTPPIAAVPTSAPSATPTSTSPETPTAIPPTQIVEVPPTSTASPITEAFTGTLSVAGRVFDAIYAPDGRSVWLAFEEQGHLAVGRWDFADGPAIADESSLDVIPTSCLPGEARLSMSADGHWLVLIVGKAVVLIDTRTSQIVGASVLFERYHSFTYERVFGFSPDGIRFAMGNTKVEIYKLVHPEAQTPRPDFLKDIPTNIPFGLDPKQAQASGLYGAHTLVFSPDGQMVAVGGAHFLGVWSVLGGSPAFLQDVDWIESIVFSPDSRSLAFVSDNGKLDDWDISGIWQGGGPAQPRRVLDGGVGSGVAFSPDGNTLAIGMSDGSVQFRDSASFELLSQVRPHWSRVTSVTFSTGGQRLLTSSYDGSVSVWAAPGAPSFSPGSITPEPRNTELPADRPEALSLIDIHMLDVRSGWGIEKDGRLLRTADGGQHWRDVSPAQGPFTMDGLFVLDDATAWATPTVPPCIRGPCSNDGPAQTTVWKTADGGESWVPSQPLDLGRGDGSQGSVPYVHPDTLQFVDPQHGWLLVSVDQRLKRDFYRLFHTDDGGATWSRQVDENDGPPYIRVDSVAFLDAQFGFMSGEGMQEYYDADHFFVTHDGGATWERAVMKGLVLAVCRSRFIRVRALSPQVMSVDSAVQAWARDSSDCSASFRETHAVLAEPNRGVYEPWRIQRIRNDQGAAYFMNDTHGWMLVIPGPGLNPRLERTQDGGVTWTTVRRVNWEDARFSFVSPEIGWAVVAIGDQSALVRTADGGQGWVEIKPSLLTTKP